MPSSDLLGFITGCLGLTSYRNTRNTGLLGVSGYFDTGVSGLTVSCNIGLPPL